MEVFTRVQELIEDWEAGYQAALGELAAWQLDTHVQDCSCPVCTTAYRVTRNELGTLAGTLGHLAGDLEPVKHGPELTIINTGEAF